LVVLGGFALVHYAATRLLIRESYSWYHPGESLLAALLAAALFELLASAWPKLRLGLAAGLAGILLLLTADMVRECNGSAGNGQSARSLTQFPLNSTQPAFRPPGGGFRGIRGLSSDGHARGRAAAPALTSMRCPAIVSMSPSGLSLSRLLPSRACLRFTPHVV